LAFYKVMKLFGYRDESTSRDAAVRQRLHELNGASTAVVGRNCKLRTAHHVDQSNQLADGKKICADVAKDEDEAFLLS
jgi:hypothetical protein